MSKSDLHKLGKTELLQIIYEQEKQITTLKSKIENLNKKIDDRTIDLKEAGSIAEASLKINKIFEEAQKAADEYLNSVKKLGISNAEKVTNNITNEEKNKNTTENEENNNNDESSDYIELKVKIANESQDEDNNIITVDATEIVDEIDEEKLISTIQKGYELLPLNLGLTIIKPSIFKRLKLAILSIIEKNINIIRLKIKKNKLLNKIKKIGKEETLTLKKNELKNKVNSIKNDFSKKVKLVLNFDKFKNSNTKKKKKSTKKKKKSKTKKNNKKNKNTKNKDSKNKKKNKDVKNKKNKNAEKKKNFNLLETINKTINNIKQLFKKIINKKENVKENKKINLKEYDLSIENIKKALNKRKGKESKVNFVKKLTYSGIVIIAFAIIIATRVFNVIQVTGNSMEPSLFAGDLLISTKIWGYKKGDMIAFYYNDSILIKRIIATEGDIVYIDDEGNVYVNSQKLEEEYVKDLSYGNCDITFPYRVPDKELFVLGDNRNISIDSRSKSLGSISEEKVLGKITINLKHLYIY